MKNIIEVYGHVMSIRKLGKIGFIMLRTFEDVEQVTVKKELVDEKTWKLFKEEIGFEYFLRVKGELVESSIAKLGKEILAHEIEVIAPSKPLPIDLSDKVEAEFPTRIKYRYLDIRRPKVRAILRVRSTLLKAAREFFYKQGFVELNFPIIIATATEGERTYSH